METAEEMFPLVRPFVGASGTCSNAEALKAINEARGLLWNKTDFERTMDYFAICCVDGCFCLPSAYKQIRLAWLGKTPISIGNEWFVSIPQIGLPGRNNSCHRQLAQIGGHHVTFRNYDKAPYQAAIQAESPQDQGAEITLFGTDLYGTSKKETLQLGMPGEKIKTTNFYKGITAVIKSETQGRVRLYALDNQYFSLLAIYQPYDVNPKFRKYHVAGWSEDRTLTLYCKKKFLPIEANEEVEFPLEAIKFALMALSAQKDRDTQKFLDNLSIAVQEINRETADNDIPTASPMRMFHQDTPEHLIRF